MQSTHPPIILDHKHHRSPRAEHRPYPLVALGLSDRREHPARRESGPVRLNGHCSALFPHKSTKSHKSPPE